MKKQKPPAVEFMSPKPLVPVQVNLTGPGASILPIVVNRDHRPLHGPARTTEPFDLKFWGYAGPTFTGIHGYPIQYRETGAPVASGTKNVRRTFGGSRKARGMASDTI